MYTRCSSLALWRNVVYVLNFESPENVKQKQCDVCLFYTFSIRFLNLRRVLTQKIAMLISFVTFKFSFSNLRRQIKQKQLVCLKEFEIRFLKVGRWKMSVRSNNDMRMGRNPTVNIMWCARTRCFRESARVANMRARRDSLACLYSSTNEEVNAIDCCNLFYYWNLIELGLIMFCNWVNSMTALQERNFICY